MKKPVGDYKDVSRYIEKVREAIKERLPNIVSSIDMDKISSKGKVKVRIPDIEPYWFKPDMRKQGQGGKGGSGRGAGKEHVEVLVVEMDIEELKEMIWEELGLPNFVNKKGDAEEDEVRLEGYTRKGPLSRLSIKKTLLEQIKSGGVIHEDIFRYKDIAVKKSPVANAVVVFARDRSGSITEDMVGTMKTAAWWVLEWLRSTHQNVRTHFITHDYVAQEVSEKEFFGQTSGGGTRVYSAVELAWKILSERYPENKWNRYIIYFSDGDASGEDIAETISLVNKIAPKIELFAYGEVVYDPETDEEALTTHFSGARILEGGLLWVMERKFGPRGTERVRYGPLRWNNIAKWLSICFGKSREG